MSTVGARAWVRSHREWVEQWFFLRKNAERGLAASRILIGSAMLGILLSNFTVRHALWGPASTWIEPFRDDTNFGRLPELFGDSQAWTFTLKYLLLMAIAVAVIVGWRTRMNTLLLVIGVTALVERNTLVGDAGDNIARIGLLLMVFMSTAEYWSIDARRRRRAGAQAPPSLSRRLLLGLPVLPGWLTNAVHNLALMALALQVFILYTASALFKVQGEIWQTGTALYYPLASAEFSVFPTLNSLMASNAVILTAATYFAVYVQLFFAVGLLHPLTRRLALVGVIAMHIGIAILMGLPWFSLSMIAFDAIFVTTATFVALEALLRRRFGPALARWRTRMPEAWRGAPEEVPAEPVAAQPAR
ncbi:HTTM domain-containing protein [Bogoriella caseilytica]|uniref:Vitamin K-dependent gamma-carboxylase-like protein n=1 Tax=Bogoriella caseilytica TaxID=56055 RepID=A0A3N2BDG2_9MICO|nr:HTTM domain-containing protein [Bogoriella caseilytica]ROR73265.1 vitamin K-dependent gamma-carboxylase-like protein [Bogoriella caseilytica]